MKDKIFGALQRVGKSFMLPIAVLPAAGLLLGLGSSLTNPAAIQTYRLEALFGENGLLTPLLFIMSKAGGVIFNHLPLLFAVGVAIGMAKREKETAALASLLSFFVMHASISALLQIHGKILEDGTLGRGVLEGTIESVCGIPTLQMGVFGGIIVGMGTAALHNRFYKIQLPSALAFFGGSRFVPVISTLVYVGVGAALYFLWPPVQNGIYSLGSLVTQAGYGGTFAFGVIKRALVPFGLHHVFYLPFWQTGVGGTMEIGGQLVQGGQNILFAQLADPETERFSCEAARYFSGEFLFMIFGLPGAALAMYRCARPERRRLLKGLFLSAALTSMLTGITEPLEFTFLFAAPVLFAVHALLAGTAYMLAHMFQIAVGVTFSGGFLDLFLFGILQGNEKTGWLLLLPLGAMYFVLYYGFFTILIKKLDLKTLGREPLTEKEKEEKADSEDRSGEPLEKILVSGERTGECLEGKADSEEQAGECLEGNPVSKERSGKRLEENSVLEDRAGELLEKLSISKEQPGESSMERRAKKMIEGLGGRENILDLDCCATRLRCTVRSPELLREELLRESGTAGILRQGQGIQLVYGPQVSLIKSQAEEELFYSKRTGKILYSPFRGRLGPITEIPDQLLSERLMGDGYMVMPKEGIVYAPEDCEITFVFPTKHALGIRNQEGLEYLLHIGVDTVKLEGRGFRLLVEERQKVKKGERLMTFDLPYIREHAKSAACAVIFTSLRKKGSGKISLLTSGEIQPLEAAAKLERDEE